MEIYSYCKTKAWLYCKVFNKEYNIVILFAKRWQNFDQKLFENQTPTLTWKSKTRVTSCELRVQIYELQVQIHEL